MHKVNKNHCQEIGSLESELLAGILPQRPIKIVPFLNKDQPYCCLPGESGYYNKNNNKKYHKDGRIVIIVIIAENDVFAQYPLTALENFISRQEK